MGATQVIDIENSMEGKRCNGVGCKGKFKTLDQFYTKGRNRDGSPRYESICKKCKAAVGKKRRLKFKKAVQQVKKNIKIDIQVCEFIEEKDSDFVKEDLEKFLKEFAFSLIFDQGGVVMEILKGCALIRVSTNKQDTFAGSLEQQKKRLQRWVEAQGIFRDVEFVIDHWFEERTS